MNYQSIYEQFIASRRGSDPYSGLSYWGRLSRDKRCRKRGDDVPYREHHHIVARFDGGDNRADNIVTLTHREHVFAHLCLAKAFGGKHYAALWGVAGMHGASHMDRKISIALHNSKAMEKARFEMARQSREENGRIDKTIYEWHNVKTGECVNATRHGMPFSNTQAKEYLNQNPSKKWNVKFAAGEWYVLGIVYSNHEEARKEYDERGKRNSERQRGKRRGAESSTARKVRCIETGTIYESQGLAAAATGLRQPKISQCCTGARKTTGGYHWEYAS